MGFRKIQCHTQENKEYPGMLDPTVHLALRAAQPREAYMLQKKHLKNLFFSWFLNVVDANFMDIRASLICREGVGAKKFGMSI